MKPSRFGLLSLLFLALGFALPGQVLADEVTPDEAAVEETPIAKNAALENTDAGESIVQPLEPAVAPEVQKRKLFRAAYENFSGGHFQTAAPMFFQFILLSNQDEENYEWAQFFFGLSLEKMQLSHAAIDTLADLAKRKPNTRIVAYILEMFETISRDRPFDRELVLQQVLNDQDYDFSDTLISDFVHYYQGLEDWENGLLKWANKHFRSIKPGSYYYLKTRYHQAKVQIYQGDIKSAIDTLQHILGEDDQANTEGRKPSARFANRDKSSTRNSKNEKLIDEVRWTLARLYYENGDYDLALEHYKRIRTPLIEQASFLMEQAWNVYQKGDAEKAMGYLYAFEAPSFKRFFSPEFYLLKSLIYKDVCHYDSALSVVDSFQQRYGRSLNAIYSRRTVADQDNEEVMNIALTKQKIAKNWKFIQLLERESKSLAAISDQPLRKYLEKIYSLQIEESAHSLKQDLNDEFEQIANDLLRYEEEANLMRYEIGIDMYQRVSQSHYKDESGDPGDDSVKQSRLRKVVFPFQGEFWNEELANYKVTLDNRCNEFEQWDVFFK